MISIKAHDKPVVESRDNVGEQEADGPPQGLSVNDKSSENKEDFCP